MLDLAGSMRCRRKGKNPLSMHPFAEARLESAHVLLICWRLEAATETSGRVIMEDGIHCAEGAHSAQNVNEQWKGSAGSCQREGNSGGWCSQKLTLCAAHSLVRSRLLALSSAAPSVSHRCSDGTLDSKHMNNGAQDCPPSVDNDKLDMTSAPF